MCKFSVHSADCSLMRDLYDVQFSVQIGPYSLIKSEQFSLV